MSSLSSTEFYAYLISKQIITKEQLAECLKIQQELRAMGLPDRSVLMILLDKKYLTKEQMAQLKPMETGEAKSVSFPEIPGYELQKKLGEGGMGAVYLARQISMDRPVAIKILSRSLANNKDFIERFHREARASAILNHRNIVSGIDVGAHQGYHYFVMEYVQGNTVDSLLEHGPLTEKKALDIIYEVALALDHAHQSHFVHRDIKPENIMVTSSGEIKLLDFGLVKQLSEKSSQLTQENSTFGTPFYISPEQASGEPVDIRSDIYSLGATLFHLITGRPPFSGNTSIAIMSKHLTEGVPDPKELNPKISGICANLIFRMMEKKPAKRFQTPKELMEFIHSLRQKGTVSLASIQEEEEEATEDSVAEKKDSSEPVLTIPKPSKNQTKVRQSQTRFAVQREKEGGTRSKHFSLGLAIAGVTLVLILFWGFSSSNRIKTSENLEDPEDVVTEKKNATSSINIQNEVEENSKKKRILAQEQLDSLLQKIVPNFEIAQIPEHLVLRETLKEQKQIYADIPLNWDEAIQQINARIDFLGEQQFQEFSQKSSTFVQDLQFTDAVALWKSFPPELEISEAFQKARNAQEEVWLNYNNHFEKRLRELRELLETKQFEETEKLKTEILSFCLEEKDRLKVESLVASFDLQAKAYFQEKQDQERERYAVYFQEELRSKIMSAPEMTEHEMWKKIEECESQYPAAKNWIDEDRELLKFFFQSRKHLKQLLEEKKKIRLTTKEVSTAKLHLESLGSDDLKILFQLLEKGEKVPHPEILLWEQMAYGFFMNLADLSWDALKRLGDSGKKYYRLAQYVEKQGKMSDEKKAESLYKEALGFLEKKSKTSQEEGRKILKNLLDHYAHTVWIQSQKEQILEKMKLPSEKKAQDKVVEKLLKVIHGKLTFNATQNTFRVDYDFTKAEQFNDFDIQPIGRERGRFMGEDFFLHPAGGLFGNEEVILLWIPILEGDVSLEFTCYPAETKNVGCTLHYSENQGHYAYVSFEMFRDFIPWADGSAVLYELNMMRLQSLRPTQTLKNPFPGLTNSITRTELKTNNLLFVKFVCSKDKLFFYVNEGPSSPEKPYLQGVAQNSHEGRVGIMSPYGAIFTRLTIMGTFEKEWFSEVLKKD